MSKKEVNLYTTFSSSDSEKIKEYLSDRGIDFESYDIGADFKAYKRMLEATRGACHAPVVEVGNQIVCGFDSDRLNATIAYEFR